MLGLLSSAAVGVLAACAPSTPALSTAAPAAAPTSAQGAPSTAPTSGSAPVSGSAPASGSAAVTTPTPASVASSSAAAVSPTAAGAPPTGGTWRHAVTADLDRLDPHLFTPVSVETSWLALDRLTAYDQNLKPQPMLAESWDINSDYTQFKLNLRKGVMFHSGRELTSDDVKYSLLRPRDPKVLQAFLAGMSNWFSAIDTPDKYTLTLTSDTPRPGIFDALEIFNIVDRVSLEGPDAQTTLVGTGPFTFVEWSKGDHLTFAKNANYWQSGRPYLDSVIVNVREPSSLAVQMDGGAFESIKNPLIDDFARYKSDSSYQAMVVPNAGNFFQLGMNTQHPPFDDKRVRQAINYALDRTRFAETIFKGAAEPIDLPWSTSSPAYDAGKNTHFAYDLDRARDLLQQAGVSNLQADILVNAAAGPQLLAFAQVLQQSLSGIGVSLTIQNLQQPIWVDDIINKKPEYTGLWGAFDTLANLQPGSLFGSIAWRTMNNASNFSDDGWAKTVAAVSSESDPSKQKQVFAEMNDYILDQSFTVPLVTNPVTVVATQKAHALDFLLHNGAVGFTNAWLSA